MGNHASSHIAFITSSLAFTIRTIVILSSSFLLLSKPLLGQDIKNPIIFHGIKKTAHR
ncbi:MAG: hypothetical protein WCG25_00970 [bacterium]